LIEIFCSRFFFISSKIFQMNFFGDYIEISKTYLHNLKSHFTCSNCSKYFKRPMLLPCGHTMCNQHLDEAKENKTTLKCGSCQKEFDLDKNMFTPNLAVQIDDDSLLREKERSLKDKIIESFTIINKLDQDFKQTKIKFENFDMQFHDHFQDIRRQIDLHREESPKVYSLSTINKINAISLVMIDRTKDFERAYYQCLNETLLIHFSFESMSINVEEETNKINELFRNPRLKLKSMENFQKKQRATIAEIKENQEKMFAIRNHLNKNKFLPILDSGIKFGALTLYDYKTNLSKSHILNQQKAIDLIKLCEFSSNNKFSLLYRGSQDGFEAKDFHAKCDGHLNTLTIIKASNTSFIFGGFASLKFDSKNKSKQDRKAFIFSLTNEHNRSCKMKVKPKCVAITCHPDWCTIFGNGDIRIANKANQNSNSFSGLGSSYDLPENKSAPDKKNDQMLKSFLAGSYHFKIDEIEVYIKEK